MIISKIDNTVCKSLTGLKTHLNKFNISLLDYYIKYENFEIPICKCGDKCKFYYGITFRKTCGNDKCLKILMSEINSNPTNEQREKARQNRINYLKKKTGLTAWERRTKGYMSYLEQTFYDKILALNFFNKYDIVNEYCTNRYFIDFAFINEKIAVELDGKTHFVNGKKRILHDIIRDEKLINEGWKMFRIKYNDNMDDKINELIEFIGNPKEKNFDSKLYYYSEVKNNIKKKPLNIRKTKTKKYEEKQKTFIELIKNSEIDFNRIGWVNMVSEIIEQKPQKVNIWMKRFMPIFYESCFKRKTNNKNNKNENCEESWFEPRRDN